MGANDVQAKVFALFDRINTTRVSDKDWNAGKDEVLDSQEIEKAEQMGFSLFELKENMTKEQFEIAYYEAEDKCSLEEFEQKTNQVHVRYLQVQYGSSEELKEGETIEQFETRLKNELNQKINNLEEEIGKCPFSKSEFDEITQIVNPQYAKQTIQNSDGKYYTYDVNGRVQCISDEPGIAYDGETLKCDNVKQYIMIDNNQMTLHKFEEKVIEGKYNRHSEIRYSADGKYLRASIGGKYYGSKGQPIR